jgi:hypothetical protein
VSYSKAGGRCSAKNTCDSEFDKRVICSTATLYDDSTLKTDQNSSIIYSYTGFVNSYFLEFPFKAATYDCNGLCGEYDPRFRPWYVTSISGAKNVILIVDFSGSMGGEKIEKAIEATISVINTLG